MFREGVLSHSFAYAILGAFMLNGAGRWRRPIARDKPGKIVILGGGFAAIHCAMRLERLRGRFTNVDVVLVHQAPYFLFHPLLPDVIGGAVQPGNIVNPIRRICPHTRFREGEVSGIDTVANQVHIARRTGETIALPFDQLVVALDRKPAYGAVAGLLDHGLAMLAIGDALHLRQRVLEALEEAVIDTERQRTLLSFCVVGGGLRGCATAAAIRELLNAALPSYTTIARDAPRIVLLEANTELR